jgi:arsenite oxidase small subunit
MQRREFLAALAASCASPCIAPAEALAAIPAGSARRFYARALLTDDRGKPLRAASLARQRNYLFHYPYATTPCFLLDLGRTAAADAGSAWPGGVGPGRSLVAYSAICSHQLTYPTRDISFISYRAEASPQNRHAHVIHCCSEHSQYDPAQGARVLAGPAPHPLAAILLEHDPKNDTLHALGTLGIEMFDTFFEKFGFRLALENGAQNVRKPVANEARVIELDSFCRQQVRC